MDDDKNVLLYTNCSIAELESSSMERLAMLLARQLMPNTNQITATVDGFVVVISL